MNDNMPIDRQDPMEGSLEDGELNEGEKCCPANNCGNPIANDESSCGEH